MPSRFDGTPDELPSLTPEIAERVVARFLERQAEIQRAEALEKERQAEVARVQELADLLGTTSEDVLQLASEVRREPFSKPETEAVPQVGLPKRPARWPIHAGYLTLVAACLFGGFDRASPRVVTVPVRREGAVERANAALMFDPYLLGYVRSPLWSSRFGHTETYPVDPSLKPPPPGLKVSLVTPRGRNSIVGPPGTIPDTPQAAESLRRSIRSLIAYEEARTQAEGVLSAVDEKGVPLGTDVAGWHGRPIFVGWHQVEVTNGRRQFTSLVPDRRYAKRLARFEQVLRFRLDRFADTKFFPSQPPADVRAGFRPLTPPEPLPKGVALKVSNGQRAVWLRGEASLPGTSAVALTAALDKAASVLGGTDRAAGYFQVTAVYPGGEKNGVWPLQGSEGPDSAKRWQERTEQIQRLSGAINEALGGMSQVPPSGSMLSTGS